MKTEALLLTLSTTKGTEYEAELRAEKARSDKEWKIVLEELNSVQDEKKSVHGMEKVVRMMLAS